MRIESVADECLNLGRQLQALLLKGREKRVNIRFFNGRSITLARAEIECIDGGTRGNFRA